MNRYQYFLLKPCSDQPSPKCSSIFSRNVIIAPAPIQTLFPICIGAHRRFCHILHSVRNFCFNPINKKGSGRNQKNSDKTGRTDMRKGISGLASLIQLQHGFDLYEKGTLLYSVLIFTLFPVNAIPNFII